MLPSKICNFISIFIPRRQLSSALYVTHDKAQKTFALLTPVIDFDKQLENVENLRTNISSRNFNINLDKLIERWNFFQCINDRKVILEHTKLEIGFLITDLMKQHENNKEDIEKLKMHIKLVKDDLKNIKTFYYGIEEDVMLNVLNIPNMLDKRTPLHEDNILYSYLEKTDFVSKSHVEIGRKKGYLKYVDPYTCFLKSDAALFELALLNYFQHCLGDAEFIQFVGPNFCKTVIAEGCGQEPSSLVCIKEEDQDCKVNQLHLCGGSSLLSYMAYFARHALLLNMLPLKCFSRSKVYSPSLLNKGDMFSLSQNSVVSVFMVSANEEDYLEFIIEVIKSIYQQLGLHFRISLLPANKLQKSESLHLSVQMFSNNLSKYIEVGNISMYEDYLSKRLLFTCTKNKERIFPKIISGSIINAQRVLACVLENNSINDVHILSDLLKRYL